MLLTNTVLREVSRAINTAPVSAADLVREYSLTVVCREADEIHIRALLSNSMSSAPLSFQSLTSRDYEDDPNRIEVTATLKLHPKDQSRLETIASRLSMEKGVSSVSWGSKQSPRRNKPARRSRRIHETLLDGLTRLACPFYVAASALLHPRGTTGCHLAILDERRWTTHRPEPRKMLGE
ncbi:hypothetical protein BTHE68_39260 [Burkholderia sp. THE68]|nr:hypothetical protein BTHE68_39260 [Burkholderia sp. THE68]